MTDMLEKLKSRGAAFAAMSALALAFGAAVLPAGPAEAQWRGNYNGGGAYYGGGYRGGYPGGWRPNYGYGGYYGGYRNYDAGAAVAAGVIGLAAGAIIGSALSQPAQPQYYTYAPSAPAPVYVAPPAAVYSGRRGLEPFDPSLPVQTGTAYAGAYPVAPSSPDWNAYCASKYRSYDPASGTFLGYDGKRHYCR
jgi:peptidoglycan/LPS O-acetylase OafA/YrhL